MMLALAVKLIFEILQGLVKRGVALTVITGLMVMVMCEWDGWYLR